MIFDERLTIAASSRDCSPHYFLLSPHPATKSEGPGLLPGPLICGDPNGVRSLVEHLQVRLPVRSTNSAEPRLVVSVA